MLSSGANYLTLALPGSQTWSLVQLESSFGAVQAYISSPHLIGSDGDRHVMLGEVARLKKERGVI
jgi:hypothetical protein